MGAHFLFAFSCLVKCDWNWNSLPQYAQRKFAIFDCTGVQLLAAVIVWGFCLSKERNQFEEGEYGEPFIDLDAEARSWCIDSRYSSQGL